MLLIATKHSETIVARLRECVSGAGYRSNVGRTVHMGRLAAGAIEAPCCFVVPGRGADDPLYATIAHTRTYEIRAFADANDHPELSDWDLVDQIVYDVRRTLEARGALPGLDSLRYVSDTPGYREDGGTLVGVLFEYVATYHLDLSDPSNPV